MKHTLQCFSFVLIIYLSQSLGHQCIVPPTCNKLTIEKVISDKGYPLESHTVITEDGYVLVVHRIRHGKTPAQQDSSTKKPPLLLQHGLMDTSSVYTTSPSAMAYYMADAGYDVWINNSRGNCYSREHIDTDCCASATYWNFSFHEMGMYDIPAVLNYIRHETEISKVHYVGMSMGSTMFLVMGTMRPEFLDYVDCAVLMGPVARPQYTAVMATRTKRYVLQAIVNILSAFGMHDIYKLGGTYIRIAHRVIVWVQKFCTSWNWTRRLCNLVARGLLRAEKGMKMFKRSVDAFQYTSHGTSMKTFTHYLQMAQARKFQQYDYGAENNERYGGSSPPEYDLSKITIRIYIISGGVDKLADPKDVQWLSERLSNCVVFKENYKDFDHANFVFGSKLKDRLYKDIDFIIRERPNKDNGLNERNRKK